MNLVPSYHSVIQRAVFPLPPIPRGGFNFWFARFPLVNKDPETFAPFQSQVLSLVVSINYIVIIIDTVCLLIYLFTRNTCIAEPREAPGGIKCQGWKGERIGVNVHVLYSKRKWMRE